MSNIIDRRVAPAIHPIGDLIQLEPEEHTLNFGTKAYILRSFDQPVIRLDLVFPAGHWQQPQYGVAFHTAKLLSEGTVSFTAKEIADRIAFYGASLHADPSTDRSTITLLCLSKHFNELLVLVQELWQKPLFPEVELQHLKQRTIQHIKVERQKNAYLANEALNIHLYGPNHPYRGSLTIEEINQIDRELISTFHQSAYLLDRPVIFMTGAITNEHLKSLNGILIDGLEHKTEVNLRSPQLTGEVIRLKGPNHIQAALKVGRITPGPDSNEYPILLFYNEVLGGYFGSRLMRNLRENKGYTYGIHSYIQVREHATAHIISTEVKAEIADLAIEEIRKEMYILSHSLIDSNEIENIKNSIAGKFASERATIFDAMDTIKFRVFNRLDKTYYSDLLNKILDLTPSDILEYSRKSNLLDDNTIIIVN